MNTRRGLFIWGSVGPAIFQQHMELLLQGLESVSVYLNDILVAGHTLDEHFTRLAEVLKRLEDLGMCLNKQKCLFLCSSIEYLGYVIDEQGIYSTDPSRRKLWPLKRLQLPQTSRSSAHSWGCYYIPPT